MSDEYRVTVRVYCRECGAQIGYETFDVYRDTSLDIDTYTCQCANRARQNAYEEGNAEGYTRGYDVGFSDGEREGYDQGYEEGCEANIEFVDDDEPAKDYE